LPVSGYKLAGSQYYGRVTRENPSVLRTAPLEESGAKPMGRRNQAKIFKVLRFPLLFSRRG